MIYTAPNFSFIDAFVNNAKGRDARTEKRWDRFMEGAGNAVKGGAEAWKWQQRKNAADELEAMQNELRELQAQRDRLATGSATPNLDSFIGGYNPAFSTGRV